MNILQLTIDYPPPLTGGLPRQVHGLAHALAVRHTVGVVASGASQQDGPIRVFGAAPTSDRMPSRDLSHLAQVNLGLTRALFEAALSGTWDVIHAHDWMVAPAAIVAKDALGTPVVTTIHTDAGARTVGSDEDRERRLGWEAVLAHASSLMLAVSAPVRDIVAARYADIECRHVSNGVDVTHFAPSSATRDTQRILFVGRLVPYKGCQDLIRAVGLLRPEWPDLTLEIVGDGFYRPELEALVNELRLWDAVTFAGWKEAPDLVAAYHRATLAVVPSHEEAFGLVAIEAMASGTPVVATDISAFTSYIEHERTGILAASGDAADLARHIDRLLRDPVFRNTVQENALQTVVPHFAWENVVQNVEAAYRDAIERWTAIGEIDAPNT